MEFEARNVSALWDAILPNLDLEIGSGDTYDWEDPYKKVSQAIQTFIWKLIEDSDARIEFVRKYDLNIADQIRLHRMIDAVYGLERTGETDNLVELLQARANL